MSICRELLEFKRSFSKSESVRFASLLSVKSSVSTHVMIMISAHIEANLENST